jgi:hypothetical protein
MRATSPSAIVLCGADATLDVVGRLVYSVRQVGSGAPVLEYREAMPVSGSHAIPSLGSRIGEATAAVRALFDGKPSERRPPNRPRVARPEPRDGVAAETHAAARR